MTSVIKFNNFALHSSVGFLVPYLGVHFQQLAGGTAHGFELVEWASTLLAVPTSLVFFLRADRNWTHRLVYLQCVGFFLLSAVGLLIMTVVDLTSSDEDDFNNRTISTTADATTTTATISQPVSQLVLTYLAFVYLTIFATTATQMLEFFNVNLSKKRNNTPTSHPASSSGYGSMRLFGSLGALLSSTIIMTLPQQTNPSIGGPFLLMLMTLCAAIFTGSLSLTLVYFWPDHRPFDTNAIAAARKHSAAAASQEDQLIKFDFTQKIWASKWVETECWLESGLVLDSAQPVTMLRANFNYQFDTREEDAYRNIRRCSLAPLGDSFMVKQFELDHKNVRHFNFVTNVQPLQSNGSHKKHSLIPTIEYSLSSREGTTTTMTTGDSNENEDSGLYMRSSSGGVRASDVEAVARKHEEQQQQQLARYEPQSTSGASLPLELQFRLLADLFKSGSFQCTICFLTLIGFMTATRSLANTSDSSLMVPKDTKVATILGYLAEIAFYHNANHLIRLISHKSSLSLIVIINALLHGVHLIREDFRSLDPSSRLAWSLTGSLCGAWLNCVLAELACEFAKESLFTFEDLIRRRIVVLSNIVAAEDHEVKQRIQNGTKATVVCLLLTCLHGIGHTFGSMFATTEFVRNDFETVCWCNIGLALAFLLLVFASSHRNT